LAPRLLEATRLLLDANPTAWPIAFWGSTEFTPVANADEDDLVAGNRVKIREAGIARLRDRLGAAAGASAFNPGSKTT